MKVRWRTAAAAVSLGTWMVSAPGCASGGAGDRHPLAALVVSAPGEVRVRLSAIEVFQGAGYLGKSVYTPEMTFERRAGLGSDILRGGWLDSKTIERVRIQVVEESPARFRIEVRASTVQYPGDRVLEEEFPIRRSGSYQKLLEQVRQRIAAVPAAPDLPAP
jgi:hypothetical protein